MAVMFVFVGCTYSGGVGLVCFVCCNVPLVSLKWAWGVSALCIHLPVFLFLFLVSLPRLCSFSCVGKLVFKSTLFFFSFKFSPVYLVLWKLQYLNSISFPLLKFSRLCSFNCVEKQVFKSSRRFPSLKLFHFCLLSSTENPMLKPTLYFLHLFFFYRLCSFSCVEMLVLKFTQCFSLLNFSRLC